MKEFIVQLFYPFLSLLHHATHEWIIAIMIFTLLFKMLLSPFTYRMLQKQHHNNKIRKSIMPLLDELKKKYEKSPLEYVTKQKEVEEQHGINNHYTVRLLLLNGAIMMILYLVFSANGIHMSSHFIPWVSHFQIPDPFHVFPVIVTLTSFLSNLLSNGTEVVEVAFKQKITFSLIISLGSLFFLWKSPIALAIYWITSNVYTMIEKLFFKILFHHKNKKGV